MADATPAIRLKGLTKAFGAINAVDDLHLDIAAGEFFSMLGPSGSGKTTVLRLIAGFETPTAGTIELFGQDVTANAPFDRDVNTVFQDYALFPHMTVLENIGYGLRVRGVAKRERNERAQEALESVQAERVRVAQAAASSPVDNASASRWHGRPWSSRRCCCSTSHWARSTSSSARRCRSSSRRSSANSASRSSS